MVGFSNTEGEGGEEAKLEKTFAPPLPSQSRLLKEAVLILNQMVQKVVHTQCHI
jgi:hypothetical protein